MLKYEVKYLYYFILTTCILLRAREKRIPIRHFVDDDFEAMLLACFEIRESTTTTKKNYHARCGGTMSRTARSHLLWSGILSVKWLKLALQKR
jgi:hypothetical protein